MPADAVASEDEEDADFTLDLDQMLADADAAAAEKQASSTVNRCVACLQCLRITLRMEALHRVKAVVCGCPPTEGLRRA